MNKKNNLQTIVLGGGCFWCIEAVFKEVRGVEEVISGYAGGESNNPDYESVSGGETGHAEVIKVIFNNEIISLEEILEIFFAVHNPTTLNQQGNDLGSQYRSVIFYTEIYQKGITEGYIKRIEKDFKDPIVTEVGLLNEFYKAEDYHLDYYNKNKEVALLGSDIA